MSDKNGSKRYVWGLINPGGNKSPADVMGHQLLPPHIEKITIGLGLREYDQTGVDEAMAGYWSCVDSLVKQGAQSITLVGLPVSAVLTRPRVLELIEATRQRHGITLDTSAEALAASMQHMNVRCIAVASRWKPELNNAVANYFGHAGIEVLHATSLGQNLAEAFAMDVEEGMKLSVQLGRQAMRAAPQAEGLLVAGGAWLSKAAVPILEEDFGKPVFTNELARVWRFVDAGIAAPIHGWGRLLERR